VTARQDHRTKRADETFENAAMALTDRNCIQEEINSRLNSGNAYYSAVQNFWTFLLLCENGKVKIYRNIIKFVAFVCIEFDVILRGANDLLGCSGV
jgi:hypothetical protein